MIKSCANTKDDTGEEPNWIYKASCDQKNKTQQTEPAAALPVSVLSLSSLIWEAKCSQWGAPLQREGKRTLKGDTRAMFTEDWQENQAAGKAVNVRTKTSFPYSEGHHPKTRRNL